MHKNNLKFDSADLLEFESIPAWNMTSIEIKPPTRYFALPPIGIGTVQVESLCSYVKRLAEAHCVSPVRILFPSKDDQIESIPYHIRKGSMSVKAARAINGIAVTAETIEKTINKATAMPNIKHLTLLPWQHLISRQKLFKDWQAWCPACYFEQLQKQELMYEKLAWTIRCVTVCPTHQIHLAGACPYCGKRQKHLSNESRIGFCDRCKKWLGRIEDYQVQSISNESLPQLLWIANAVGKFLSSGIQIKPEFHTRENFRANLKLCINQTSFGNINDFAHFTEIWHLTIRRMLQGSTLPTMEMLMKICFTLDLPTEKLFLDVHSYVSVNDCDLSEMRDRLKSYSKKYGMPEEVEELRKRVTPYLENLLTENPPISGREAARRIGWRDYKLLRNFPDIYNQIVLRYKEFHKSKNLVSDDQVRKVLCAAMKEAIPPSLQSVLRRLGCKSTGYGYQQKFPLECKEIAQRFTSYRNRLISDEKLLNEFMDAVVTEYPPPSASQVAKRLKITRGHLQTKFSDRHAVIADRFKKYTLNERKRTLEQLETEIETAVREIIKENMYPSEEKIKARLSCGYNDGNFKKVLFKVKNKIATPFKPKH